MSNFKTALESQGHFVAGAWRKNPAGEVLNSFDPATEELIWRGTCADETLIHDAVDCAKAALIDWATLSLEEREKKLSLFIPNLERREQELAEAISIENGKPLWEAKQEVAALKGKWNISVDACQQRYPALEHPLGDAKCQTYYRPHGPIAILSPYNFPTHLLNGHLIPALLAGNTVIIKPSEQTPMVSELYVQIWEEVGLPPGVINLIQGGGEVGKALCAHPDVKGIFFTGSAETGMKIKKQGLQRPDQILALEMGGNNPLIVDAFNDLEAACYQTVLSAFITGGQRCTCARRLILIENEQSEAFIARLTEMASQLKVGPATSSDEPFMGPLISKQAQTQLLDFEERLLSLGGKSLLKMEQPYQKGYFVTPAIVDMTGIYSVPDEEAFGPLLQVYRVSSLKEAVELANKTRFGLSLSLFSTSQEHFRYVFENTQAGIVNWNSATTGASSKAPFGGVGISGNHRPSAYFAADYAAYPVASVQSDQLSIPKQLPPGISLESSPENSSGDSL